MRSSLRKAGFEEGWGWALYFGLRAQGVGTGFVGFWGVGTSGFYVP